MKKHHLLKSIIPLLTLGLLLSLPGKPYLEAKGVKTSYKRYTIHQHQKDNFLCEPYQVKKGDWLYKIFRKKGEISERDFPRFLTIFKEINPLISNIDSIKTGSTILIPLKKIKKEDYEQTASGTIDVPVIEFSSMPEDLSLKPFVKEHRIKKGETVSDLLHKDFLKKGGLISEEGLKAFQLANPNIKNINIVYEGEQIFIPDPSLRSQPWFRSLFGKKPPPELPEKKQEIIHSRQEKIAAIELARLKKYASLIGGTLMSHGEMYFPGNGTSTHVLDLSSTPLIETKDGSKILILPENGDHTDLVAHVKAYWKNLKTQALTESLDSLKKTKAKQKKSIKNRTNEYKHMITQVLSKTGYQYIPEDRIPFVLNNIQLEAPFGRVIREDNTDLLINFGHVYGSALDVFKKREFEVISITPQIPPSKAISLLFSHLGYSVWENPSFFTGSAVEQIKGIYLTKKHRKFLIPLDILSEKALKYLESEDVTLLSIKINTNI